MGIGVTRISLSMEVIRWEVNATSLYLLKVLGSAFNRRQDVLHSTKYPLWLESGPRFEIDVQVTHTFFNSDVTRIARTEMQFNKNTKNMVKTFHQIMRLTNCTHTRNYE